MGLTLGCKAPLQSEAPAPKPAPVAEPVAVAVAEPDAAVPMDREANAQAAVANPARPQEDRDADAHRKPAEIMDFFVIEPGMHVADLMAGKGYFSELLGYAVGTEGRVYVQNSPWVIEKFAEAPLSARLARMAAPQLQRVDAELDALHFEAASLDAALMILFYHDTYWQEVDRPAMNRQIFTALKPGGVYGIIDHHAATGAGAGVVKTLHRIERELVVKELLEAGFELDAESQMLAHADDARSLNVFDPAIRGKTDQFVLRFRKPNP